MTREEAINIISQMIKDEEGFLSDNTVEAHKMAIKALEQEPRWIPISEKAPEESGMYLVSGRWKNEPYEVWICEFMYLGELKGWANDAERPIVTAWMPLPAPYEPQESEGEE